MARRDYNRVRTATFEEHIAKHNAGMNYEAEHAIRYLAQDVGAPIDEARIETLTRRFRAEREKWEDL